MSKWKAFSFMKPAGYTVEIEGEEITFYPVSVKALFKLQAIAGPVAEAITVLLTKHESDTASRVKPGKDGRPESIDMEAIPTETARLRTQERTEAVRSAVETLLNPKNSEVLAYLMGDSLRDVFDRDAKMAEKIEFVESLPAGILAQMGVAFVKANKGVFGPLAEGVGDMLQKGMAAAGMSQEDGEEIPG